MAGRDRVETEAFEAFRGGYPFRAEFCAPAKGWEKGSVETGVKYVRNLVFRPRLAVESWAALNAAIRHAYRPVWVKLYHDRVAIAVDAEVVAEHRRVFRRGAKVLDAFHVLPLLERKHRAVAEAGASRPGRPELPT